MLLIAAKRSQTQNPLLLNLFFTELRGRVLKTSGEMIYYPHYDRPEETILWIDP
jgi:hypothetical protein